MAEGGIHAALPAQYGEQMVDVFGQRGFELYGFAAFGVDEAEPVGV